MADTPSIVIIKRFPYRGVSEEYSNKYHFTGDTPTTDAGWKTLADAIITSERALHWNNVEFVRAYGYVAGNEHSVSTVDYVALGGTLLKGQIASSSTLIRMPGDAAVVLRALRAGKNSKGRNTYCFKYFHPAFQSDGDTVAAAQVTAVQTHGAKMLDGTLPGGAKWCAPQGQALSVPLCLPVITTRTLKRRGKRPSS